MNFPIKVFIRKVFHFLSSFKFIYFVNCLPCLLRILSEKLKKKNILFKIKIHLIICDIHCWWCTQLQIKCLRGELTTWTINIWQTIFFIHHNILFFAIPSTLCKFNKILHYVNIIEFLWKVLFYYYYFSILAADTLFLYSDLL
jgi:hypothetical protein